MLSNDSCPQCGRTLPSDAPSGVCPQCLLGVGMDSDSQADTLDRPSGFTPPKPDQLTKHFPQLEILDLVGYGGMGAVYKARQRGLDRLVALKILPPEVGKDPSFEARFAREARALARLSHPNIVAVHDSGNVGGLYYVLMEYVDGVNLREAIQTNELTPEEALAIVPQICEALQYAHDEGVVHRDIKPENILLDKKGRVKIADFGLARLLGQAPDNFTLTGTHQIMGTPKYMAPEQMEGSHEVDHRADIYSLGVVFYEMLTGELPLGRFDAPSHKVKLDKRVDEVVLRTLEKEPSRRYQTAGQVKTDVESISDSDRMAANHWRAMQGCEYKSNTTLFGLPLVHVATGIDPKTGRKRIAKGIVAVGDVACGFVAVGGVAFGVFATGGAAVGLFSFAGAAVGLLVAIGGAAIGLGFSVGGLAVGTVAMGGMAVGYLAHGGGTLAVHGVSGSFRDPIAGHFFEPWAREFMQWFTILMLIPMALIIVGMNLTIAAVKRHQQQPTPKPPRKVHHPHQQRSSGCLTALLIFLLAGGFGTISICGLGYMLTAKRAVQREQIARMEAAQAMDSAKQAQAEYEAKRRLRERADKGYWDMTANGLMLNEYGIDVFDLDTNEARTISQILQDINKRYFEFEQEHITRERNEAGHDVITIEKLSDRELAELEEDLWAKLDEVLDVERQRLMRNNLNVHVGEGTTHLSSKRWQPGILGWGKYGAKIELWKVGKWYHWKGSIPISETTRIAPSGEAPELPDEFARYWAESETIDANGNPTIDSSKDESQE